jgi:hypothetical protein
MNEPPAPLERGQSYISVVPTHMRNGHTAVNKDYLSAMVQHLSTTYPLHAQQAIPTNIWGPPAKQIMKAIYFDCTITESEHTFLTTNLGFMYHEVLHEHTTKVERDMTTVHKRFSAEELGNQHPQWDGMHRDMCIQCKVLHINPGSTTECRLTNGPLSISLVTLTPMDMQKYHAMMIGTQALQVLPMSLREKVVNMGSLNTWTYKAPGILQEDGPHTFEFEVQARLNLIQNLCLPVLIEFTVDPSSRDKAPTQLYYAISTLARLQQNYAGPLILIIPPHLPDYDEDLDRYEAGKVQQCYLTDVGIAIGRMKGVGVCGLQIQTEKTVGHFHCINPTWAGEPLFARGRLTREYMRRTHDSLMGIIEALQPWSMTEDERRHQIGYRSVDLLDVVDRE